MKGELNLGLPSNLFNAATDKEADINGRPYGKGQGEKSKTTALDEQQMLELEDQLVQKIMSHFKDNFNYSPNAGKSEKSEDVFYSPIGERTI